MQNISVLNIGSRRLRRVGATKPLPAQLNAQPIIILGLCGAAVGAIFLLWAVLFGPEWSLLKGFDLLTSLAVGAVFGCMTGSLIGTLIASVLAEPRLNANGKTRKATESYLIAVRIPESQKQSVKMTMEECGAFVTVESNHRGLESRLA